MQKSLGNFQYRLKTNLSGACYVTPIFKKKEKQAETETELIYRLKKLSIKKRKTCLLFDTGKIKESEYNSLIKHYDIEAELIYKLQKKKDLKKYDRKNKISLEGTELKSKQKQIIKNAILHRYYSTNGNYGNRMKFFTFTIQENFYNQKLLDFQNKKTDLHPDTFFNKKFSMLLENLQKRKEQNLENYIWIAEKTKKGIIHYHCVFESYFIDVKKLSTSWAKICGFKDFQNSVQFGFDRKNFKGEQIENLDKIDGEQLSIYLTKYVASGGSKIFGRAYGMSKNYTKFSKLGINKVDDVKIIFSADSNETKIIFKKPRLVDYETGEIFSEEKILAVPSKLLFEKQIEIGTDKVPFFILSIEREILFRVFYPELYKKSYNLLKARKKPKNQTELTLVC